MYQLSLSLALTLLQGEESVGNSGDSHVLPGRPSLTVAASLASTIFQMKGRGPVDFGGQVDFGDQLTGMPVDPMLKIGRLICAATVSAPLASTNIEMMERERIDYP